MPTDTVNQEAWNESGLIVKSDAVYLTARNATTGTEGVYRTYVGQRLLNSTVFYIYRTFLTFDLSSYTSGSYSVSAGKFILDGRIHFDSSTTDFNMAFYEANDFGTLSTADFNNFVGWQASGIYSGVSRLSNYLYSSAYSNDDNEFRLTSAGLTLVEAKMEASAKIHVVLLSQEDVNASQNSTHEYVGFDNDTTPHRLEITYTDTSGYGNKVNTIIGGKNNLILTANTAKVEDI